MLYLALCVVFGDLPVGPFEASVETIGGEQDESTAAVHQFWPTCAVSIVEHTRQRSLCLRLAETYRLP